MNELMTGLLCQCGHDYACHAPAPHTGCRECDCNISRADIAERGGKLLASAVVERDALREALEAYRQDHDSDLESLAHDMGIAPSPCDCWLCLQARAVPKGGNPS